MPDIPDRQELANGFDRGHSFSANSRRCNENFFRLDLSNALASQGDERGGAKPFLQHTQQCRLRPNVHGDVMAPLNFPLAGAQGGPTAAGDPNSVPLRPFAAHDV